MSTSAKYSIIFAIALTGLFISFSFGPLSHMGTVFLVNESYERILFQQYLWSGLVSSFLAGLVSYIFKAHFGLTLILLLLACTVFTVNAQSGDPDSLEYIGSAIIEFLLPFLGVSLVVIGFWFGVSKIRPRVE